MTPASATPRRRRRRRNGNASVPVSRGSAASARSLAAGLWRLRHAQTQRMKAAGAQTTQAVAAKKLQGRRCHGNKSRLACQCTASSIHGMEAYGPWSAMEKATKWDGSHHHHPSPLILLMEAELEKARCHISDLEEERRVTSRRLERFLRKLREEKASWKDKARHAVAALREERAHRRQLEQANAKLTREAAEARAWARQQAQSYEAERKAREVMEEACSELTREVEEDQAEVELLRRECLRMREEMEEERRMLQMAEVWREERVQMKLSDAKLALQTKYDHLAQLQAQMEAFLRNKDKEPSAAVSASAAAAAVSAPSSSLRPRGRASQRNNEDYSVDADSVLEHFRRKEEMEMQMQMQTNKHHANRNSPASNNDSDCNSNVSPATDLFLAKVEDDDDEEYANGGGSSDYACSWFGTSDRSAAASVANGNTGGFEARSSAGASRRSLGKNTALIRRLWRSAIAESRSKAAAGWSPSSDNRRSSAEAPPAPPPQQSKQSLRDKLMEARMMDDHKPAHALVLKHKAQA
ncbi:unnamed protein product [Urochloa decumbens]|uniref:Uncharacterized protein n=1 Tax=Urochloa decumbens TaxID=240449 RepID=A0ABC9GCS5_9POAL